MNLIFRVTVSAGDDKIWPQKRKGLRNIGNHPDRNLPAGLQDRVIHRIQHIPDEDVEMYFNAADVLAWPYVQIFQSGVPFLAYNFGLPVIATDVGSLRQDLVEGRTGFICRAKDSSDLANMIHQYFDSELFRDLERRREENERYANQRYAWEKLPKLPKKCMKNSAVRDKPVNLQIRQSAWYSLC